MKKINIVAFLLVIWTSFALVSCVISPFHIKGNGILMTSEISASQFERINSGGSAEVRFHLSPEYRVDLTADSNIIEFVEITTRGNTLHIGTKNGYSLSFTKWLVDVYSPELTGISIAGSGTFKSEDIIVASKFNSSVSGSGRIEGLIETDNFSATISGSGRITVAGYSNDSSINISGSGRFSGLDFCINNANVRISGSGYADICVSDNLSANISGSGRIHYRGEPSIDPIIISGSGRINKL